MEVTSGFKTTSVVLLFRFGSESGAIHPKIVCDGTGKNVAGVRVVCIKCNQSQDCVQRTGKNAAGSCVVCIECYQSQDCVQRGGQGCCFSLKARAPGESVSSSGVKK
jgi:hypothetical protein